MHCWRHGGPRAPASRKRRTAGTRTTAQARRSSGTARRSTASTRMPAVPPPAHRQSLWQTRAPATAYRRQPPAPSRREQERERVKEAARFCADSVSSGWQEAVADQITDYAQTTWERLSRSRRKRRNCKALARIARSILKAKAQIHKAVGTVFGRAVGALGATGPAQAFTEELMSNIPLPIDAKMIAVARGVQVAGILLCVMDNRDLTECECFIDLALAETKERLNQILVAAMSDWAGLAKFRPQTPQSVS